jgi:hypothetical protein
MGGAGFRFGGDPDRHRVLRRKVGRIAVQRDDFIGVRVPRFDAVIRPLKGLDRVLAGGKGLAPGGVRFSLLESFRSAQPEGVFFGVVGALEGEAAEPRPLTRREVEAEEGDVGAGDGVSGKAVMVVERFAHGYPSSGVRADQPPCGV